MRFSTIAFTTLVAAVASANMGVPAKRHIGAVFKRQDDKCGGYKGGDCCETGKVQGSGKTTYTVCSGNDKCQQVGESWCCCPDGGKCDKCATCGNDDPYGKGYKCWTAGGHTYYSPENQVAPLSSGMESGTSGGGEAAASSEAAAASSEAAAVSSQGENAISSIYNQASAAVSSLEAAASTAAASVASAASEAGAAATSAASAATGNETLPQPTAAINSAPKFIVGVPALALALFAGILML